MKTNAERRPRVVVWLGVACLGLASVVPLSAQEPKPLATLKGHTGIVYSVAYSPDGKTLASGNQDKTIKLWDVPAAKELDAGQKEAKADNKDRERLQGAWHIVSFEEKGVTSPGDGTHTLTFTANKIHQFDKGPKGA